MRQFINIDRIKGETIYARGCTASRDYVIVRVPHVTGLEQSELIESRVGLTKEQIRFIRDNVTPKEHLVATGQMKAEKIDRSR